MRCCHDLFVAQKAHRYRLLEAIKIISRCHLYLFDCIEDERLIVFLRQVHFVVLLFFKLVYVL